MIYLPCIINPRPLAGAVYCIIFDADIYDVQYVFNSFNYWINRRELLFHRVASHLPGDHSSKNLRKLKISKHLRDFRFA